MASVWSEVYVTLVGSLTMYDIYIYAKKCVYFLRKDERRNYRADATTTTQVVVETGLKGKCWQLWLTYNCTSLDTIAGVVVGTGYGWQLAIRWRDVS